MLNFIHETTLGAELTVIDRDPNEITNDPNVEFTTTIERICIGVSPNIYNKLLALAKTFDFSREKEFNEYLETEKKLILQNNEGLFKAFYKTSDLSNQWSPIVLILSGYYIYFFKNAQELQAFKYIYIRGATA